MAKLLGKDSYKKLSTCKIREITVTPKVKNGKLLFDRKNKDHRYIVEDDDPSTYKKRPVTLLNGAYYNF